MDTNILTYGLGSVAFFGIISYILQRLAGSVFKSDKEVKDYKQEENIKKIAALSKEQEVITAQLREAEKVSEDSKKEISAIVKEAAKQVQGVLNASSIDEIDKTIDEGWSKL